MLPSGQMPCVLHPSSNHCWYALEAFEHTADPSPSGSGRCSEQIHIIPSSLKLNTSFTVDGGRSIRFVKISQGEISKASSNLCHSFENYCHSQPNFTHRSLQASCHISPMSISQGLWEGSTSMLPREYLKSVWTPLVFTAGDTLWVEAIHASNTVKVNYIPSFICILKIPRFCYFSITVKIVPGNLAPHIGVPGFRSTTTSVPNFLLTWESLDVGGDA